MDHFKVDVVCHGRRTGIFLDNGVDPYALAKKVGKFKLVDSNNNMTTEKIVERIILHR